MPFDRCGLKKEGSPRTLKKNYFRHATYSIRFSSHSARNGTLGALAVWFWLMLRAVTCFANTCGTGRPDGGAAAGIWPCCLLAWAGSGLALAGRIRELKELSPCRHGRGGMLGAWLFVSSIPQVVRGRCCASGPVRRWWPDHRWLSAGKRFVPVSTAGHGWRWSCSASLGAAAALTGGACWASRGSRWWSSVLCREGGECPFSAAGRTAGCFVGDAGSRGSAGKRGSHGQQSTGDVRFFAGDGKRVCQGEKRRVCGITTDPSFWYRERDLNSQGVATGGF